jgi:stage II sporulation protein D
MKSLASLALLLSVAAPPATLGQSSQPHPPATLRIGLWTLWHDKQLTVSPAPVSPTPESTTTLRLCATCPAIPLTQPWPIQASAASLVVPGNRRAAAISLAGSVTLTAHGESLTLQNPVRITARKGELVLAVTLPIESYVERVVASESSPADGPESLQALAIVVRSFALHQPHGHADYDLCDSTHCQLLHWAQPSEHQSSEHQSFEKRTAAHAATLSTAGETLWYHGQRATAWFHQNCGGRTATPQEAWPSQSRGTQAHSAPQPSMPWLVSRADPYCTAAGPREWSTSLALSELTGALAAAGLVRPGWKTLTVARRGESGRAVLLQLDSTQVSAEDFRLAVGRALGWGKILSTWFEVSRQASPQGDQFLFHGRGSGHGVGLCQAGAAAMSAQGHDAAQILAQYFPGATVADESTGQPWQSFPAQGFTLQSLTPADAAFLPQLRQAFAEAQSRSGLQPASPIVLRAFHSTSAFRDATLAPGWIAAFTEGNRIATQPLSTLAARKLLVPILRHEFLHALVESQAAPASPLWLREGLVEAWSDPQPATNATPSFRVDEIDRALLHATTEAESQAAHRAAAVYAQRLLDRYGRTQVLNWLRTTLPATVTASIE